MGTWAVRCTQCHDSLSLHLQLLRRRRKVRSARGFSHVHFCQQLPTRGPSVLCSVHLQALSDAQLGQVGGGSRACAAIIPLCVRIPAGPSMTPISPSLPLSLFLNGCRISMSSETAGNNHEAAKVYYDAAGGDGAPGSRPASVSAGQVEFQLPLGEGNLKDPVQKSNSKHHARSISQNRLGDRKPASDGDNVWD